MSTVCKPKPPSCTSASGDQIRGIRTLFRDGMDLVEETAAYLDGAGRVEPRRSTARQLTLLHESMRLTTRPDATGVMAAAAPRVKEGEMT